MRTNSRLCVFRVRTGARTISASRQLQAALEDACMRYRYVTADVFTGHTYQGNPLAVVLDAQGLDTRQMQRIAREFNYSETSFVMPPHDRAHTARVRIFTPDREVPFAGHPNVGTAVVLAREQIAAGVSAPQAFVFE